MAKKSLRIRAGSLKTEQEKIEMLRNLREGKAVATPLTVERGDKITILYKGDTPLAFDTKFQGAWIPNNMVIHTVADKVNYIVETKVTIPPGIVLEHSNSHLYGVNYSFTPALLDSNNNWIQDPSKPTFSGPSALKAYQEAYKYTHNLNEEKRGANARLIMGIHYPIVQELICRLFFGTAFVSRPIVGKHKVRQSKQTLSFVSSFLSQKNEQVKVSRKRAKVMSESSYPESTAQNHVSDDQHRRHTDFSEIINRQEQFCSEDNEVAEDTFTTIVNTNEFTIALAHRYIQAEDTVGRIYADELDELDEINLYFHCTNFMWSMNLEQLEMDPLFPEIYGSCDIEDHSPRALLLQEPYISNKDFCGHEDDVPRIKTGGDGLSQADIELFVQSSPQLLVEEIENIERVI
jgi:hypothetical protein